MSEEMYFWKKIICGIWEVSGDCCIVWKVKDERVGGVVFMGIVRVFF